MEFRKTLLSLTKGFDENEVRYGLIGGFALVVYGIPRTTVDLDFLVHRNDLKKLDNLLQSLGYKLIFRTENVSQYSSEANSLGGIDFIHAFRRYSLKMLAKVRTIKFADISIRVLYPEDIIGLKVQAIANDSTRKTRELADIESILDKFSNEVDWELLREYFQIFDFSEDFNILMKRYGKID